MIFEHTEERRMLADTLARFLSARYPIEVRHAAAASPEGFSRAIWQELAELGIPGALLPESAGGYGGSGHDIAVVFEEVGRSLVVEPLRGTLLVGQALSLAGVTPQSRQGGVLSALAAGTCTAALALDEPGSHHDPLRIGLTARQTSGGWVLHGSKAVVEHGATADHLLVSARSAGAIDAPEGISLFLLPAGTPGLERVGTPRIDGGQVAALDLEQVELPADALVGPAGGGFALLQKITGLAVLSLCAEALGAMEVARNHTLDYLRTRRQFGAPIGSFQALQHRMATLLLEVEQARSAVIRAACALDQPDPDRGRALAAAKVTIGRVGNLVAEESIQLHGGIGMTWELPLSHYAKRLVMIDHEYGDESQHLARYIAHAA